MTTDFTAAIQKQPMHVIHLLSMIVFAAALVLMVQPAWSDDNDKAVKLRELDTTYNQLLRDPTDVDLTLRYAELAVDVGDYEAAIPPLERLLITNPKSSKIRLELGILYYLLGSHDVARNYLTQVSQSGSAKPFMKQQADNYLSRIKG